jgi:PHD/YefM family antitoxin component YafN of YafNO toxin-antitoxin module
MRTFTMTSLANETGEVTDAADHAPVALTRDGRLRYVMLRIEEFDRLTARGNDPRRSLTTDETPKDIEDILADDLAAL